MAYTDAVTVRRIAQLDSNDFLTGMFVDNDALESFITDTIIPRASEMAEDHCRTSWTDSTVPEGVKYAVEQIATNILHGIVLNKQGPTVQIGDYKIESADRDPITPAVAKLLSKHVAQAAYVVSKDYQTDEIASQWEE